MNHEIPFDAIVTLFVFLVGVPAVVLQMLPPESRQVMAKRPGELFVDAAVPFLLAIGVVVLGIVARAFDVWNRAARWSVVLSLTLLIGVAGALRVVRKYGRRDEVVRRLAREAARGLEQSGRLSEDTLQDLVEFGRQSEPGRPRAWVLEELLSLTEQACSHASYSGDHLEDLVIGAVDVATTGPFAPDHENAATAVALLRRTLRELDRRDEPFKQADALHAIYGMSRLGRAALRLEGEAIPLRIVQALGVTAQRHPSTTIAVSQVLFDVGVAAIADDEMLVAIAALQSMIALVEQNAPASGELVADVLALLAHFWAHGAAGRQLARERLARLAPQLKDELGPALAASLDHCVRTAHLRTADKVREMASALERPSS